MRAFLISLCALRARCDLTIQAAPRGRVDAPRRLSVNTGSDGEDCGSEPSVRAPDGHPGNPVFMRVCGLVGCCLGDATQLLLRMQHWCFTRAGNPHGAWVCAAQERNGLGVTSPRGGRVGVVVGVCAAWLRAFFLRIPLFAGFVCGVVLRCVFGCGILVCAPRAYLEGVSDDRGLVDG